jgi:hypothetical protein
VPFGALSGFRRHAFLQLRAPVRGIAHRHGDGLLLPDQYDQPLAAFDAGEDPTFDRHGPAGYTSIPSRRTGSGLPAHLRLLPE